ncbi:MAG: hypothetical protein GXP47_00885 [Acidobacteria bacterium]|nr:hypothetical protein [Acidobacteriota bacterium]
MRTSHGRGTALLALLFAVAFFGLSPAHAQSLTGVVGVGYAWQSSSGNESSFRTQTDLRSGFILEDLDLKLPAEEGGDRFHLQAWGFGRSEPAEGATLAADLGKAFSLDLRYDRRRSFFEIEDPQYATESDRWHITRWRGSLGWDGWSFARLSLNLRHTERGGTMNRVAWGLNELYPIRVNLDESMDEAAILFETKTLPVHIRFEQAFTRYTRKNRPAPNGSEAIGGDPDLLTDIGTTYEDTQDVPTSRLDVSWAGRGVEVAGNLLYSSADLDSTGAGWQEYAIAGGGAGTIRIVDDIVGSATTDTLAGGVAVGVRLAGPWRLQLRGNYRDASSDSTLMGERLLKVTNPDGGGLDLSAPLDDSGRFDFTDLGGEVTVEYRAARFSVWGGGLFGSRDVSWRRFDGDPGEDVARDTSGYVVGGSWRAASRFRGSLEYRHGSFEKYVFRTDPETVDAVTLRLTTDLGSGFSLVANGSFESADNPASESSLDRSSGAGGLGVAWASADGKASAGVSASLVDLTTTTSLVLPSGDPGVSRYDLNLRTLGAYGAMEWGLVLLRGSLTWMQDTGDTWPVTAWNGALRLGFRVMAKLELAAFLRYWSYDEDLSELNDFDVTRYGLAVRWSF